MASEACHFIETREKKRGYQQGSGEKRLLEEEGMHFSCYMHAKKSETAALYPAETSRFLPSITMITA